MPEPITMKQSDLDAMIVKQVESRLHDELAKIEAKNAENEKKYALRQETQELFEKSLHDNRTGGNEPTEIERFGRFIIACGCTAHEKYRNQPVQDIYKTFWPDDKAMYQAIQKTMEVSVPTSGGFGVPQILSPRTIEYLYANAILSKVGVTKFSMPSGNISLVRNDAPPSGGWGNENTDAIKTAMTIGRVNLSSKKYTAIVPISNTLLRTNAVDINGWVVKALQRQFGIALDTAFLYGTGVSGQPLGITLQTGIATGGTSSTVLPQDGPIQIVQQMKQANVQMVNPYWLLAPSTTGFPLALKTSTGYYLYRDEMMLKGTLNGVKYHESSTVSFTTNGTASSDYGDFILVDLDQVIWAVGMDMEITVSREANYVNGGTQYSAFSRDETLIRVIGEHDFGVMQPKAVAKYIYQRPTTA